MPTCISVSFVLLVENRPCCRKAQGLKPRFQVEYQKSYSEKDQGQTFPKENFPRIVDDFDFDEEAFLAALDQNEPVGLTGEIATGEVIGVESDGVYVDIGGKAPGFMPKNECGLGVITNLKDKFPK